MVKVMLDPGHGGKDPGASGNGVTEKVAVLSTAFEVKAELEKYGVTVAMTRTTDVFLELSDRANKANAWGADLFVSCHYNAGGGVGAEVIHSIYGGTGKTLAENIMKTLISEIGVKTHKGAYSREGSNGDYYAVIRQTNMPGVIVEPGFVDSSDSQNFDTLAKQQRVGKAIAHGILNTLGIKFGGTVAPPTDGATTTYTVVSGDTLYSIATKFKTTVAEIKSLNGLTSDTITVGQKLKIPSSGAVFYTVVSGDTLYGIATKYSTTVQAIKDLNGLTSDTISVGQVLQVK